MSCTTSSLITRKDVDKATLVFSINNFERAKHIKKVGQLLKSDSFIIGVSKFNLQIYPSGETEEDQGFVSVYLNNASEHSVTGKYTMIIGNKVSQQSFELESDEVFGSAKFVKASEVGQNMKATVTVTLLKEEVLDGLPGGVSLTDWQFMKKREAENQQKLEQKLVKLEQKIKE